jgi:hypothetical protein
MVRYLAKFLLLIAVFIIAYMVIKSGARRRDWPKQAPGSIEEDMVRCKVCGVHLPRSESVESVFLQRGASAHCEEVTPRGLRRARAFAGASVVINPV